MSTVRSFSLGAIEFEAALCEDPSTGVLSVWVYRTDVRPRALVATGDPEYIKLTPDYADWDAAVIEQAVQDSFEDAPA
jgi:hypothetical protein